MKLRGLSDQALRRIAQSNREGMAFEAVPPVGQTYKGVIEFPGFHTTGAMDIAAAYATGRIMQSFTSEDENGVHFTTDYPVVVKLDMANFSPTTDYDAEEMVREPLIESLNMLISDHDIDENSDDPDIIDAAYNVVERGYDQDSDGFDSFIDTILDESFSHFGNPLSGLLQEPSFPDSVRQYAATGDISQELLMAATDQYRYENDVDEQNILEVYYVSPIASEEYEFEAWNESESEEFEASWAGFELLSTDDYGGHSYVTELAWQNPEPPERSQLPLFPELYPEEAREEYHGTTYKRLLMAAPELADVLPAPPSPPYRDEGEG